MNKYQTRAKIYKITCNEEPDKVYIGSSCEPSLARRLAQHKRAYKCYLAGKYNCVTSFDLVKYDSATITLIESFQCNNKDELLKRERYWIEEYGGSINKVHPTRTDKEYREDHKETFKQYRQDNADKIKQYHQDNADSIKQYLKEYRQNNAEKIKQYKSTKYTCICGITHSLVNKTRHMKSLKHNSNPTVILKRAEEELNQLKHLIASFE